MTKTEGKKHERRSLVGKVDLSQDRIEKKKMAALASKPSPFKKQHDDLMLKSFDGNSVAQAYDSTKYTDIHQSGLQDQQH